MPTSLISYIRRECRFSIASVCLLLLLAAALPLTAQISLSTIVSSAQRKSAAVRLAEADLHKSEAVLAETHDVYIPIIDINAGVGYAQGFMGGQVPSLWTGTAQSQVFSLPHIQYERAARAGVSSAKLNLMNAREQVALDASILYIQLDTVTRELAAANLQSMLAEHLVEIEQQRSEAGIDSVSLYLDARLTAANIKLKKIHLESGKHSIEEQLSTLTGMPAASIQTISSSIPQVPRLTANSPQGRHYDTESIHEQAVSKSRTATGDTMNLYSPQVGFSMEYLRHTSFGNDYDSYFTRTLPANNYTIGISFTIPILDLSHRGKARESAAEALHARIEAEQADRQNDLNIILLNDSLRELDVVAEIAELKKEIAAEQVKSIEIQLNEGNGSSQTPQASPRSEQLAKIDERQKYIESEDANFDLNKARLNLVKALGHMQDWLQSIDAVQPANDSK